MFQILSAQDAVQLIPDGANICVNCFLALNNPAALHAALYQRYISTGHPGQLTLICAAGYGDWDETHFAEPYVEAGAVRRVIASHFSSMPITTRKIRDNEIEGYALPLGVLSHTIRAMAGGHKGYHSQVGLGIYVDPRLDGPAMNACSTDRSLVTLAQADDEDCLYYKLPPIDVALLKGTSVDPNGNISLENEFANVDALAVAMAAKRNGGKVIVQVEQVTHTFSRPRNVIIPGALVDAVVVCEQEHATATLRALNGDIHVPSTHMDYWMNRLASAQEQRDNGEDCSARLIGTRGAQELRPGNIANIGVGLPEMVAKYSARRNILKDVTLTVESGGFGGLPASGKDFGATIGADMVIDMASQMDFYDGGGLDVCFMGALEVDCRGNVNVHRLGSTYVGVGGFANLTRATKRVVFCLTFTTKGLCVHEEDDQVQIVQEGSLPKFKKSIQAISFSAADALKNGQQVLYVTERCVLELTPGGLHLKEVYPGIDPQKDIQALLDFPLV